MPTPPLATLQYYEQKLDAIFTELVTHRFSKAWLDETLRPLRVLADRHLTRKLKRDFYRLLVTKKREIIKSHVSWYLFNPATNALEPMRYHGPETTGKLISYRWKDSPEFIYYTAPQLDKSTSKQKSPYEHL